MGNNHKNFQKIKLKMGKQGKKQTRDCTLADVGFYLYCEHISDNEHFQLFVRVSFVYMV